MLKKPRDLDRCNLLHGLVSTERGGEAQGLGPQVHVAKHLPVGARYTALRLFDRSGSQQHCHHHSLQYHGMANGCPLAQPPPSKWAPKELPQWSKLSACSSLFSDSLTENSM